ncbi:MAG: SDR family oxidoreductase [Muribaculum sp.]|nr:SDR family oxidoreductase [Muribaculum sp.]
MADNYLENKMEEYRRRQGANSTMSRKVSPTLRPGEIRMKFPPRRVFVTGGANGIGRAVVKAFADAGCKVAFCDIDRRQGPLTAQSTGSKFYPVDVTDTEALHQCMLSIFRDWGDIDILINNVGICDFCPLTQTTVERFDRVINTNLRPVFITARALAIYRESLQERPTYGRIINISSTRAIMSEPDTESYTAAKGGVLSLTHALMMSLAHLNITVNCVSPGWIATHDGEVHTSEDVSQHPSRRIGKTSDVVAAIMWLALPDNDFINGENIVIDGGMTRRMMYV